ncbi:MAG: hypothetical protein WBL41_20840, partial [Terracidiphilus sp.]
CNAGAVHTWPTAPVSATQRYVRCWTISGHCADCREAWRLHLVTDRFSATSRAPLWQLSEVRRHAASLVSGEQLGRRAPTGLVLEVEVAERLSILVAYYEARIIVLLDGPGRREAAGALGHSPS